MKLSIKVRRWLLGPQVESLQPEAAVRGLPLTINPTHNNQTDRHIRRLRTLFLAVAQGDDRAELIHEINRRRKVLRDEFSHPNPPASLAECDKFLGL